MKRPLPYIALGIALLANAWTWGGSIANRRDPAGGTLLLGERELRLPDEGGEGAALQVEIAWTTGASDREPQGTAKWLDVEKLVDLGLDPELPARVAADPDRVRSALALPVHVVLELREGDPVPEAPAEHDRTRLFVIDAGRDPAALREQYRDRNRYAITRGLVGAFVEHGEDPEGAAAASRRLRGRVDRILPSRVFVPRPHWEALSEACAAHAAEDPAGDGLVSFRATIAWGTRYEPWLVDLRTR